MRLWPAVLVLVLGSSACDKTRPTLVAPEILDEAGKVVDERVSLHCAGKGARQRCVLTADLQIEVARDDPTVELATDDRVSRHRLDARPGERRALRLRAEFSPTPVQPLRLVHRAALARHRVMSERFGLHACEYDQRGCEFALAYVAAQPRAAGLRPSFEVDGLEADIEAPKPDAASPSYRLRLHGAPRPFAPGGPFFGLGVGFGLDKPDLPKLRVGWELFAPVPVAHALALELDGAGRVTLIPSTELMSPIILVLPSAGFGVGVPIQVAPELHVGIRAQASLAVPYLGLLASVDVFPTRRGGLVSPSVLLQFTL